MWPGIEIRTAVKSNGPGPSPLSLSAGWLVPKSARRLTPFPTRHRQKPADLGRPRGPVSEGVEKFSLRASVPPHLCRFNERFERDDRNTQAFARPEFFLPSTAETFPAVGLA